MILQTTLCLLMNINNEITGNCIFTAYSEKLLNDIQEIENSIRMTLHECTKQYET